MAEIVYRHSIDILASPGVVWKLLIDVERWPEWTESVERVSLVDPPPMQTGSRVEIKQPRMPLMTWTVTDVSVQQSFSWTAHGPLLRSVAEHHIEAANEHCLLTLTVRQSGPAAPLVRTLFGRRTDRYVRMEAEGLKQQAEAVHS